MLEELNIGVAGARYVGLGAGPSMRATARSVYRDEERLVELTEGRLLFYEPGTDGLADSCLRSSIALAPVVRGAGALSIAVGAPRGEEDGAEDLCSRVAMVARAVGRALPEVERTHRLIAVDKNRSRTRGAEYVGDPTEGATRPVRRAVGG